MYFFVCVFQVVCREMSAFVPDLWSKIREGTPSWSVGQSTTTERSDQEVSRRQQVRAPPCNISVTSDWVSDTQPHKSWEEKAVVFKSYGASVSIRMWWMRRDVWKKKWSSWRKWTEQRRHDSLTRFQSRRLTGKKFNDSNIYSIFLYFVLSELVLIWCTKLLWVCSACVWILNKSPV